MNCTHENGWRRPFDVIGDHDGPSNVHANFAGGVIHASALRF
jgi:hypothetical protein